MRTRSHDIVRKNPYALNAIEAIVSNCIGTGIKPLSKARDAKFRKRVQELWLSWTDESDAAPGFAIFMACKLYSKIALESIYCFPSSFVASDFPSLPLWVFESNFALVLRSVIECGECFVRIKIDNKNATVPLRLQVLESEHLDSSRDGPLPNGNVIRSGIEFNKSGKRVA